MRLYSSERALCAKKKRSELMRYTACGRFVDKEEEDQEVEEDEEDLDC